MSIATWKLIYQNNFLPVDITNIGGEGIPSNPIPGIAPIAPQVEPPITQKPRGRPRKERIRVTQVQQRQLIANQLGILPEEPQRPRQKCSTCGGIGHNSATCRRSHN